MVCEISQQSCDFFFKTPTSFLEQELGEKGTPPFIVICFIELHSYRGFYKLKICDNHTSVKSISTCTLGISHILVTFASISDFFVIITSVMVISDLCHVLGQHGPCPHEMNLTDNRLSPDLSLFSGLPDHWKCSNFEIRPSNNPAMASEHLSQRKSHLSPAKGRSRGDSASWGRHVENCVRLNARPLTPAKLQVQSKSLGRKLEVLQGTHW